MIQIAYIILAAVLAGGEGTMHPPVTPLDADGVETAYTGKALSPARTCGQCHDASYIDGHSSHTKNKSGATCLDCHLKPGRPDQPIAGRVGVPEDANCAACHGVVHDGKSPLVLPADFAAPAPASRYDITRNTGAVWSSQEIRESFLNLAGKENLHLPWDIHAARGVRCIDCHFSPNNPSRIQRQSGLEHLKSDPRREKLGDYLKRPNHALAAVGCTTCHDPMAGHDFLPFKKRHMDTVACQSCHAPFMHAPALMSEDATSADPLGRAVERFRGVSNAGGGTAIGGDSYITGYSPVVLPVAVNGGVKFAPFNLVTRYSGTAGKDGGRAITGSVTAYPVNHGMQGRDGARSNCADCHSRSSVVARSVLLSGPPPGGVIPSIAPGAGRVVLSPGGSVILAGGDRLSSMHLFGHTRERLTDLAGFLLFVAVVMGVSGHAALRVVLGRRQHAVTQHVERVYMFSAYERVWHWLMAMSVVVLIVTGLGIHFAGSLRWIPMATAVSIHNVFAGLLAANAFLALFYHVVSAAIVQFIPRRYGLVSNVMTQVRFYTMGIFLGAPHPTRDAAQRKLNPLQQITYLALLNVLFPFQIITGTLMAMISHWPSVGSAIGGLRYVAPAHNLGSWLFISFFVMHLYLITTGHTPASSLKAMITGYEE
ncbi:MAG: cytochrome b/b6 domain-containing protein, partial [Myxococcota bacterium]